MHGLILAAGCGSRLGTLSPKCLAEVGGRSLLRIQLDALREAGIDDITVVVGYRHEEIRAAAFGEVTFVQNDRFAETNSMYSFHLARSAVEGDVVVLNSDVVFPSELLNRVLDVGGSALAFDSGSGDDEEHMKVRLDDGRLVAMSKDLPPAATDGENVGLMHLSAPAARACFAAAAALVDAGHQLGWLAQAVTAVADTHPICGVDIAGLPWVEIDFPDDLEAARSEIWPSIESLEQFTRRSRPLAAFWSAADEAVAG
ncbi:MAG: L-glutamine-phosphate cytidylyltransferase [Pseudonocardiales bacterium]|nr:L-glutamine-phosphate cytidylyltransferase [Pseudonocardiales bacterium]